MKTPIKLDYEEELTRYRIETNENWRYWIEHMPALRFDSEWEVKIIPPFAGALARFLVKNIHYPNNQVSVYFDSLNRLGIYGTVDNPEPYFELYPYGGDVKRYGIDETDEMMNDIRKILNG